RWKDAAELSIVSANGNTRSATSSGKNTFGYDWTKTNLELIAGGLGSKSNGEVTGEKNFSSEKLSYKFTERNYVFEKGGWDKDRFRVNTESALIAALNAHFSLKASYAWKHVGKPPLGFGRNDTLTSMALLANY